MTKHQDRAQKRSKHKNPINFTCGLCRQVHTFDKEDPYKCTISKEEFVDDGTS